MTSHPEQFYRDWDIGPIIAVGSAGIVFLTVYLFCEWCHCYCSNTTDKNGADNCSTCICEDCQCLKCDIETCSCSNCHSQKVCHKCVHYKNVVWMVGRSVKLMYGNEYELVREYPDKEETDPDTGRVTLYIGKRRVHPRAKCLNIMLGVASILLMTFLAMVFADNYFVLTSPGCQPGLHCYPDDDNYTQYEIKNCSDYLAENIQILCYQLSLSAQPALSAVGGIFITARFLAIALARVMIWMTGKFLRSGHTCCRDLCCTCTVCTIQILVALVIVGIAAGIIAVTTMVSDEKVTRFGLAGYIIQYITIGFTVLLVMVSPWYQLLQCNCTSTRGLTQQQRSSDGPSTGSGNEHNETLPLNTSFETSQT